MKQFSFIAAGVIFAVLLFAMLIPVGKAQSNNTQEFNQTRFVIIAAPVNVFSPQMGSSDDVQQVMVKMDTVTGKTWILQLDVAVGNQPRVRSSLCHELGMHRQ